MMIFRLNIISWNSDVGDADDDDVEEEERISSFSKFKGRSEKEL